MSDYKKMKERIAARDELIKAMSVDELIENLHDEHGFGKYIILEMKERFDLLFDEDKMKIIKELSSSTKANQQWAEMKRKRRENKKELIPFLEHRS